MTRDEAERAAAEAVDLIAALVTVARDLCLNPTQTAQATLDALTACPKAPHWLAALARLHADGVTLLKKPTEGANAPPRLHS
jgi:hypothetical protein